MPARLAVVTFNEVPDSPLTFKYDVLGTLSLRNHRQYCEAHGYTFISESAIDRSRPVCWSKLSAVYEALQTHEWVLWADSDTLIFDMAARLEDFCDSRYDLVVQEQEHWWKLIGLEKGTERFPINSGVFLIKSSKWSLKFLAASYAETRFVTNGPVWDGVGDQEAMNAVIRANPDYRQRIKYVPGLQTSPKLFRGDALMVHFYGNHGRHRIPLEDSEAALDRWKASLDHGSLPNDLARFHWCCIQNKNASTSPVRGDLHNYLYTPEEIAPFHYER